MEPSVVCYTWHSLQLIKSTQCGIKANCATFVPHSFLSPKNEEDEKTLATSHIWRKLSNDLKKCQTSSIRQLGIRTAQPRTLPAVTDLMTFSLFFYWTDDSARTWAANLRKLIIKLNWIRDVVYIHAYICTLYMFVCIYVYAVSSICVCLPAKCSLHWLLLPSSAV